VGKLFPGRSRLTGHSGGIGIESDRGNYFNERAGLFPCRNIEITRFLEKNAHLDFMDCRPAEEALPGQHRNKLCRYYLKLSSLRAQGMFLSPISDSGWPAFFRATLRLGKQVIRHGNPKLLLYPFLASRERKSPASKHFGGSQWWALRKSTLWLMMDYLAENPALEKFHRFTYVPDEMFFQTLYRVIQAMGVPLTLAPSLTYVEWVRHDNQQPAEFSMGAVEHLTQAGREGQFLPANSTAPRI